MISPYTGEPLISLARYFGFKYFRANQFISKNNLSARNIFAGAALALLSGICMAQDAELHSSEVKDALKKASDCTIARNFPCADINIRLAARWSKSDADRTALAIAKSELSLEKRLAATDPSNMARETSVTDAQISNEFEASEKRRNQHARQNMLTEKRRQAEASVDSTHANPGLEILQGMQKTQREFTKINEIHNKHIQEVHRNANGQRDIHVTPRHREAAVPTTDTNNSSLSSIGNNDLVQQQGTKPAGVSVGTGSKPAVPSEPAAQRRNTPTVSIAVQPASSPAKKKTEEWGNIKPESLAVCHQSIKTKKWTCNGALDNQILIDSETVEEALARQRCRHPQWMAISPTIEGVQWQTYRCGHSLGHGDYDIAKRYNLTVIQRQYICPKNQLGDGRCATLYANQDKQ